MLSTDNVNIKNKIKDRIERKIVLKMINKLTAESKL